MYSVVHVCILKVYYKYNVQVCIVVNEEHTSCNITIYSAHYAFRVSVAAETLQTTVTMDAKLAGRISQRSAAMQLVGNLVFQTGLSPGNQYQVLKLIQNVEQPSALMRL